METKSSNDKTKKEKSSESRGSRERDRDETKEKDPKSAAKGAKEDKESSKKDKDKETDKDKKDKKDKEKDKKTSSSSRRSSKSKEREPKKSKRSRSPDKDKKDAKKEKEKEKDGKSRRSSRDKSREKDKKRRSRSSSPKKRSPSPKKRNRSRSREKRKEVKKDTKPSEPVMTAQDLEKRGEKLRAWALARKKPDEKSDSTDVTENEVKPEGAAKAEGDEGVVNGAGVFTGSAAATASVLSGIKSEPQTGPVVKAEPGAEPSVKKEEQEQKPQAVKKEAKLTGSVTGSGMKVVSKGQKKTLPTKERAFGSSGDAPTRKQLPRLDEDESMASKASAPVREVDPLDQFMMGLDAIMTPEEKLAVEGKEEKKWQPTQEKEMDTNRYFGDEEAVGEEEIKVTDAPSWLNKTKVKGKELKKTDHSRIMYDSFRKNFYIEAKDIGAMTEEETKLYRETELEGVKIRGKDCPRPIKKWIHAGLPDKIYKVIEKEKYAAPFPIQAQTIPCIMSGRDTIGIAKTGSGKTLAFVLPMIRHVLDQPPLQNGEGPIGLILCPTRELAMQIYREVKKFCTPCDMRVCCIYGGAGIAEQIADLKRGSEIIVATPGRMIDILCANQGRVTNLIRVTYLVLDEADRMFDMGFEPQIMRIMENIRPDRQSVFFSATFPKVVETLAKKTMKNAVEIIIGGRNVASEDVKQIVEVRPEDEKFRRLLEILGKWYTVGQILIFCDKQELVDNLFRQLLEAGYPCSSLHGGMDQADRDSTISDFKNKLRNVLVATSIAARGLDVKDLVLVVNYTVPNHMEDYVHRVGRTGRAGKKGTAITFLTPEQGKFAPDLVKGLIASKQVVPDDLKEMADKFMEKVKKGEARYIGNDGYRSKQKGFKFDEHEAAEAVAKESQQREGFLPEEERSSKLPEVADLVEGAKEAITKEIQLTQDKEKKDINPFNAQLAAAKNAAAAAAAAINTGGPITPTQMFAASAAVAAKLAEVPKMTAEQSKNAAAAKALAIAQTIKADLAKKPGYEDLFQLELEINDYPQKARLKVMSKRSMSSVLENCDVFVTTKGIFVPPGRKTPSAERPLYLLIDGKNSSDVHRARAEIYRILEETASECGPDAVAATYTKYTVLSLTDGS